MRVTYLHQYYNSPNMNGSTQSHGKMVSHGFEVNILRASVHRTHHGRLGDYRRRWGRVHWCRKVHKQHDYVRRIWAFLVFAIVSSIRVSLSVILFCNEYASTYVFLQLLHPNFGPSLWFLKSGICGQKYQLRSIIKIHWP